MLVASIAFTGTFASAQTYNRQNRNNNQPVFNDRDDRDFHGDNEHKWNNRYDRRVKVAIETRIVRQGRKLFRETIEIKHFPSGRKVTTIIKRVRIDR